MPDIRSRAGARLPARAAAWAAVLAMLAAAVLAPTPIALADHTINLGASGTDQTGTCENDYFKIEDAESQLEAGTHTYVGTTKLGASFSAVLTVELDGDGEVGTVTIVSISPPFTEIAFKAGTEVFITTDDVLVAGNGKAISNIAFCLDAPVVTDSPAPTQSVEAETDSPPPVETESIPPVESESVPPSFEQSVAPETDSPSQSFEQSVAPETESPAPSQSFEQSVAPETESPVPSQSIGAETDVPSPSFEQSVAGDTDAPSQPPTDVDPTVGPDDEGWRWLFVILAALLATVLLMTPKVRAPVNR
jgi:hypothetical protein